ncbi:hypothetical protein PRIC2_009702 [Phytophthora ramorum]
MRCWYDISVLFILQFSSNQTSRSPFKPLIYETTASMKIIKTLVFGVGACVVAAIGQAVVKADDPTPASTETTTIESSSGSADVHEGYEHKEHKEHHGKKDEDCDDHDHDRKHGDDYGDDYGNDYSGGYGGWYPGYGNDYNVCVKLRFTDSTKSVSIKYNLLTMRLFIERCGSKVADQKLKIVYVVMVNGMLSLQRFKGNQHVDALKAAVLKYRGLDYPPG